MILDTLEDETVARMNELTHTWHCSAAQITEFDEDETLFNFHKDKAKRAYNLIGKNRLPWYKWSDDVALRDLWKSFNEASKNPERAAYYSKLREKLRTLSTESTAKLPNSDMMKGKRELLKKQEERRRKLRRGRK